jgi:hypothetical protein
MIQAEGFHIRGKYHREDGPARIRYNGDGSIDLEEFYINGKLHREDGPAIIWYSKNGSREEFSFCFNGINTGNNGFGFWRFWEFLNEEKRQHPNILKLLAKFS